MPVLRNVSLTINKGEFLSIMGPTGVGKTTLCLALNGIVPRSTGGIFKGDVVVAGINTKQHRVAEMAQKVGIIFQDPESQLFNMSVEDEVAFGLESMGVPREEMEARITHALRVVRMEHLRHRSPFQLSGGQKQRVAIAAILAMEPEVLILDEPTSGLDPIGKYEVFSVVDELKRTRDMTIIMVEQESEKVAEFSDRVVIMDQGQILMEGPPKEVFGHVERLKEVGISVPQVAELAHMFSARQGVNYNFVTMEEAYSSLSGNKHRNVGERP